MSLMMMLAISRPAPAAPGGPPPLTTYTRTFTSNATFPVPAGVTVLDSASGHGANGSPATTTTNYKYIERVYTNHVRRSDGGIDLTNDGYYQHYGFAPANYDDGYVSTPSDPVYEGYRTFHNFVDDSTTTNVPATTGASANGFGKVFPGGSGGPAPTTSFTNVTVTGGASYSITVPSGGSITITYKA